MMRVLGAAMAALMLFAGEARADATVVTHWTAAEMASLLGQVDSHIVRQSQTADGMVIVASTAEDLTFLVTGMRCEGRGAAQRCPVIHLAVLRQFPDRAAAQAVADELDFASVAVTTDEEGLLVVSRYLALDGGVTWENIRYNLAAFLAVASEVRGRL